MSHPFVRSALVTVAFALAACGGGESGTGMPAAQDPTTAGSVGTAAKTDIVDTAAGAGSFNTLLTAVKAADLESTLRGTGPFTVFAPTDEAFAKLPAGTVESLLKPENKEKLKAILTYHVVSGNVGSAQAVKLTSAKTVSGKELKLDASSGSLRVGKANVVKADIPATNGVIHVIDTVLLPE
jgi:uncharacterized surface protein with fasciclin (FAS1) repeats